MALLVLGLSLFFVTHLLPNSVSLRARLIEKLGKPVYMVAFSLVSLLSIYLIVVGKAGAPFVSVWTPPAFFKHITMLLVLFAFMVFPAAYVPSNIKAKLKNPMLIALKLWALAHLLANGDLASMLLFGTFLAYAVVDMIGVKKRGQTIDQSRKPIWGDVVCIVVGVVAYGLIVMNHAALFGVPVITIAH